MNHMTSRVFSSATRLLALQETFAGVPDGQVDTVEARGVIVQFFLLSLARLTQ